MAQLAEQLICNQQVFGSSPNIGSLSNAKKYFDSSVQARLLRMKQDYFFIVRSTRLSKLVCESRHCEIITLMEGFPSGQRGQTVNLLLYASVVRIHHLPNFYLLSRGGAVWKLVGLITRRSQVQILSPLLDP